MKRLNNKGFAISTVIYGLSVMSVLIMAVIMGTMANNRANTKELSKSIEEDLNNFSRTEISFSAKDQLQEYQITKGQSGWYKIELWGAQGGGANGGLGAYTSGIIYLKEYEYLYFHIGKHPESGSGGETDVRVENGAYNDKVSYLSRIMVAGGGGSGEGADGGTIIGYNNSMRSKGGLINYNGDFSLIQDGVNTNGTLIGCPKDYPTNYPLNNTPEAVTAPQGLNGGGDGYFPSNDGNIGGSSFISGYAGCRATVDGVLTNNPKYSYREASYDDAGGVVFDGTAIPYYFVDGMMLAGVNKGDGYAKVERIALKTEDRETLARKNTKLNQVQYIKDCLPNDNPGNWKISAIYQGDDVARGKDLSTKDSKGCRMIDLGEKRDLDEVAVFHDPGKDYKNHTIEVSEDGNNWKTIKGLGKVKTESVPLSETETVTGIHISAYQFDSTKGVPQSGNYYVLPVLSENKVMSAIDEQEANVNPIIIDYLQGKKVQKWSIEKITNTNVSPTEKQPEYKIVELSGYKALAIQLDENILNHAISATDKFNRYARNEPQIWKIESVGNGTYLITTVVKVFDSSKQTGNILPQTNFLIPDGHAGESGNKNPQIIIGKRNINTQRFKLIAIDYSTKKQD